MTRMKHSLRHECPQLNVRQKLGQAIRLFDAPIGDGSLAVHITEKNCGSNVAREAGHVFAKNGICVECYGFLPDGSYPPIGFPAPDCRTVNRRARHTAFDAEFHTGEKCLAFKTSWQFWMARRVKVALR